MPREFERTWKLFSIVTLFLGVGWIWLSKAPSGSTTTGGIPAPRQGFQAPDFSLFGSDGDSIQLAELRGQPVLVNVWASWCPPCRSEMPAMQRVYEAYRDQGFVILAVNAANQDQRSDATQFVEQLGLTFPILWDTDGEVSRQYQVSSLPTSFFVRRDGSIREVVVGGMSEALMEIRVQELLEEAP